MESFGPLDLADEINARSLPIVAMRGTFDQLAIGQGGSATSFTRFCNLVYIHSVGPERTLLKLLELPDSLRNHASLE
jgi:hypothetical protein